MTIIDSAPLFSIITITKNNLSGLKKTAQSVQMQSSTDYEWIIIDGASIDETPAYLKTLPAVTINEHDNGLYDAMNKGMDHAKGQYFIFMNAGDVFSDADILSSITRAIHVNNPDFIYGDALETSGFYKKARTHQKIEWGMFTHHQAMIYRRTNLRYDTQYKIAADYDFTVRFFKTVKTIDYIPCAICIFEEGGISQQRMKEGRMEQFVVRKNSALCSCIGNTKIYATQAISAFIRKNIPNLYTWIRTQYILR